MHKCRTKENDSKFLQTRACNTQNCRSYVYHVEDWGSCHPLVATKSCSSLSPFRTLGVQFRNVSCITVNEGKQVPNEYCEETQDYRLEEMVCCLNFVNKKNMYFLYLLYYCCCFLVISLTFH